MHRAITIGVAALCWLVSMRADAHVLPRQLDCQLYTRLDKICRCPENTNYLRAYALPICVRFEHTTGWTPAGERWRDQTMHCLQRTALDVQKQMGQQCDCEALKEQTFATHAACYTEHEESFCNLAKRDSDIIYHTFNPTELRTWLAIKESFAIVAKCLFIHRD